MTPKAALLLCRADVPGDFIDKAFALAKLGGFNPKTDRWGDQGAAIERMLPDIPDLACEYRKGYSPEALFESLAGYQDVLAAYAQLLNEYPTASICIRGRGQYGRQ